MFGLENYIFVKTFDYLVLLNLNYIPIKGIYKNFTIMKIQKIIFALALLLHCLVISTSCSDDDSPGNNTPTDNGQPSPNFSEKITGAVYGFVTDENDNPVIGATMKSGSKTAQTDKDGYFEINDADVVKGAGVVTAELDGYFRGIRSWIAESGNKQFVRIKLLPKTIAGTFASENGGNISLSNGLKLSFPSNVIVEETSGAAYTGEVQVALQWINPVSPYLSEMMPGDLRAIDSEGYMQGLITYGMVAAELTAPDGRRLQIAEGKNVEMRTPIESELAANAPGEMPLWHFDETKGMWIEEGVTTKSGNEYVGNVSHFSFWNCDVPYNFVYMKCRIVDAAGNPLSGYTTSINDNSNSNYAYGYSNQDGYISGYVPKNASLTLSVYSGFSNNCIIYTHDFSTTTSDIDLGTLTIEDSNAVNTATIKGMAKKCDGTLITNGYAIVRIAGMTSFKTYITNGEYKHTLYFCTSDSNIDIIVYDTENGQTNSVQVQLTPGENIIPEISACNEISGSYAIVNIDGKNYIFDGGTRGFTENNRTLFNIYGANSTSEIDYFGLSWKGGIATGSFNLEDIYIQTTAQSSPTGILTIGTSEYTTGQVTVTRYEPTGEENIYNVNGTFTVQRAESYINQETASKTEKNLTGRFQLVNWANLPY